MAGNLPELYQTTTISFVTSVLTGGILTVCTENETRRCHEAYLQPSAMEITAFYITYEAENDFSRCPSRAVHGIVFCNKGQSLGIHTIDENLYLVQTLEANHRLPRLQQYLSTVIRLSL